MNGVNPREQVVSLRNLNGGAAIELFDAELAKVVADIADINTSGKVARVLTLTVKILPDEGREQAMVSIDCKTKLAGRRGVGTKIFFGKINGERVAVESDFDQKTLFDQKAPTNLREVKTGGAND